VGYRLSRKAEEDLLDVFEQGVLAFGAQQAEDYHRGLEAAFRLIAQFPQMARRRTEVGPTVRVHPYRAHIIVYRESGKDVFIQRVRHGREDWSSSPSGG